MKQQKTPLLQAALILSTIGSTICLLFASYALLFWDEWRSGVHAITNDTVLDGVTFWYMLVIAVCNAVSLYGIVQMWKAKKVGCYVYVLSQLLFLLLPIMVLGWNASSSIASIFTLLFSAIYVHSFFIAKPKY